MPFYVAVRRDAPSRVEFLYRCGTLAAALAAYRSVRPGAGQSKALLERAPDGWYVLALTDGRADDWTEQAAADATEQEFGGPPE
jgi:hypothetical protein